MRRLRELFLWAGAALGLLAVTTGLAVALFGFSFLVFRSGSMSPEIPTGAIALSRTTDAADLRAGDVVSVVAANGDRITHRVVSTTLRGDEASLVLQGDANPNPDSEIYVVTSAERVVASLPGGGYVMVHVLSPPGLLAVACLSLMLLVVSFGRTDQDDEDDDGEGGEGGTASPDVARGPGGKHRAPRRMAVAALAVATVLGGTSATLAAFTDVGTAQTGTLTAASIATPVTPSVAQGNGSAATVTWTSTSVGSAGLSAQSYEVLRYTTSTGGTPVVVCAVTTARSCTDTAPPLAASYYYSIRATYGPWQAEGARRTYTPTVLSPVVSAPQPTSGSRSAGEQRDAVNCPNRAPACVNVSNVVTVTYTFKRVFDRGGVQCWTGSAWQDATTCTARAATQQPLTTTWSVPGSEDVAYVNGEQNRGTYEIVFTATNALGTSTQTITVRIV